MIHWKLLKKLKFDNSDKWNEYKLEPIQVNEIHKISLNSEIQTDHQIPKRRPDLVLINKENRTYHLADFDVPARK